MRRNRPNDKLSALIKRQGEIGAALKEIKARRRAQQKADRSRLEALLGWAILQETDGRPPSAEVHRAWLCGVLTKHVKSDADRAFLVLSGFAVRAQEKA